ncbi:BA14K family protein [Aquibium oceanicum]|uniref:Lectin-like protein BA14k n=1 Tax=Aquibium oceanicum TaxID=1670800 RepID=A0A1L3SUP1_9HYPH|nr:BA14K family protein [Aquibium oceanicum]APH73098.1 hypothetical protein BSQ44_18275 [Aquibium oceanicum]
MNRIIKSLVLSLAVGAASLVPTLDASAGERWREQRPKYHSSHNRHDQRGDMIAAGLLGLAVGAIAAGAIANQQNTYAAPVDTGYFPAAPADYDEQRYSYAAGLEPWTAEWYRYCSQRYRSFDAQTGTFRGYDGQDHFCVAN